MKKLISTLFAIVIAFTSFSQITVFSENFEGVVTMTSSSSSGSGPAWGQSSNYFSQGSKCDTNVVTLNDSLFLTTPTFSTVGNTFVTLDFDHICKIEFFDAALIQVSDNNGATWTTLNAAQYLGASTNFPGLGKFTETAYSTWAATPTPLNSWWKHEQFDISTLLSNKPTCKVRFTLIDANANGANSKYGWMLDSITVKVAPCELIPPTVQLLPDPIIYGNGQVYYTGPYNITIEANDAQSGVDTCILTYSVNAGLPIQVGMSLKPSTTDTFTAVIPAMTIGDSVTYSIMVQDKAVPCANKTFEPSAGIRYFIVNQTQPTTCMGMPINAFPALETFDGFTMGSETQTNPGLFQNNWYQGINGTDDNREWVVGTGTTPNGGAGATGPSADHTTGSGNYIYLEVSGTVNNDTAFAFSPCYDVSGLTNPTIEFYYNMWGSTIGELHLDVNNGTGWVRDIISPFYSGQQGSVNQWLRAEKGLGGYGSILQFRFRAKSNGCCLGDLAIDDVKVYDKLNNDIGVVDIIRPSIITVAGAQDTVEVDIRNYGQNTQTLFNVVYAVNGAIVATEPWTGSLPTNSNTTHKFSTTFTVPSGPYNICAWTVLATDGLSSNDTTCESRTGLRTDTVTYIDRFDTDTLWVADNPNPNLKWEIGTPNYGVTNSAYSSPNSWDINLSTNYSVPRDSAVLYTQFFNLTNSTNTRMSFWQNRQLYTFAEGMFIEYTTNQGLTWNRLGIVNDPNGVNWYNYNYGGSSTNPPIQCWNGSSNGWIQSEYDCTFLDGTPSVQFRFIMRTSTYTGTSNRDGISIDDFVLRDPKKQDIEPALLLSPSRDCMMGNTEQVKVRIKNVGDSAISNVPITVEMNGVILGTENVTATIQPNQTYDHTFSTFTANMSSFGKYGFRVWTSHANDMDISNDTLVPDSVENVDGCYLSVKFTTGTSLVPTTTTAYYWQVTDQSTSQIIIKKQMDAVNYPVTNSTYIDQVCLKNNQSVSVYIYTSSFYFPTYELFGYDTSYAGGTSPFGGTTNITMNCPPSLTAATSNLRTSAPGLLPLPQPYNVAVTVSNDGVRDLGSVIIDLEINSVVVETDTLTFSPPLKYAEFKNHVFNTVWNGIPGCHNFKAYTYQPNYNTDVYPISDTSYLTSCIMDSTTIGNMAQYCNNFENPSLSDFVALNTFNYKNTTIWEKGTPAQAIINAANSAPNAWMTDLDANYPIKDSSSLYTPMFVVDTGTCYKLSMNHAYETTMNDDGGFVEYSEDKGLTWKILGGFLPGAIPDTTNFYKPTNWYNATFFVGLTPGNSNYPPGFSGSSSGWGSSSIGMKVNNPGGVIFRFNFQSDASNAFASEGWAIDDVCFEDIGPCKLNKQGPTSIEENVSLGLMLGQSYPNPSNGNTTIRYVIPSSGNAIFKVMNTLGEVVYLEEGNKSAGVHQVTFNVTNWNSGVYFYSLTFENEVQSNRMIVTK